MLYTTPFPIVTRHAFSRTEGPLFISLIACSNLEMSPSLTAYYKRRDHIITYAIGPHPEFVTLHAVWKNTKRYDLT